jgi:alkanesulfonate monooxygenase SsuD/methylene tetrahydromethanopterin reductase-like flavin-dependent oxidoreductase (luciferase family)
MKFGLFTEIPVPLPWNADSESTAYKNILEAAIAADQNGWDAFWTVEHHFLRELSHCSNPEILYGAVAARTSRIRLGYGVRLMPKPYNHPVRTAESVAVLDLLSGGRVDFGAGRSATRLELEGFGVDPHKTKEMWLEALEHVVGCWTNDEYSFTGRHWAMPPRCVVPKPLQKPHPPIRGATTSEAGIRQMGSLGIGLCCFSVGASPEEIQEQISLYREAIQTCESPLGGTLHDAVAVATLAQCDTDRARAISTARESFEWYARTAGRFIAELAPWLSSTGEAGSYQYTADFSGFLATMTMDSLVSSGGCVIGTPDECLETCQRYQAAGVDLLLCNLNPYRIPQESVIRSIELIGTEVIPAFAEDSRPEPGSSSSGRNIH